MKIVEKIKDIWDDFKWFWTHNPFGTRGFIEKVTGTFEYAKFIWKSECYREWDFWFLYKLIRFKMERMAIQLKKDDFVADSNDRYDEIIKALAYLHIYENVEDGGYNHNNVDQIREIYKQQQDAWNNFHDMLKDNAQKWWS